MVRPFPVSSSAAKGPANRCRHAALNDIGRKAKNQDRWFADDQRQIYVVADGMGGRPAGELVADTVVRELPPKLDQAIGPDSDFERPSVIMMAMAEVTAVSRQICEAAQRQPSLAGMGAALVAAMIRDRRALIMHLGDSRAYLIRDQQFTQLTRDHSLLQKMLDAGRLSPAEARGHILGTQLTHYAGMENTAVPDSRCLELLPGDRLLLCTDGLCGVLDQTQLAKLVVPQRDLQAACAALVRAALAAGGQDNITILLIEMTG
jgi:PPM family protein phosphatase